MTLDARFHWKPEALFPRLDLPPLLDGQMGLVERQQQRIDNLVGNLRGQAFGGHERANQNLARGRRRWLWRHVTRVVSGSFAYVKRPLRAGCEGLHMATVYGHAKYGEQTYSDSSQPQSLPPRSHLGSMRAQPVLEQEPAPAQAPPVTLPREQQVSPHREGRSA